MEKPDRISSIVWLFFALYICIGSIYLPLGSIQDPGAGFFPLLTGLFLAGLSIICYIKARINRSKDQKLSWYSKERLKKLVCVVSAMFAYALVLNLLGFLISTFLLLILLFKIGMESNKWLLAIGGSFATSISCYIIFEVWLRTQLPKGILGF